MTSLFSLQEAKLYNIYEFKKFDCDVSSISFSSNGDFAFISTNSNVISVDTKTGHKRMISPNFDIEDGLQNGLLKESTFCSSQMAFSPDGSYILVCDALTSCIRKICIKSRKVTNLFGNPKKCGFRNGSKKTALFRYPTSLTFSPDGSYILVCDSKNNQIRRICVKTGQVSNFNTHFTDTQICRELENPTKIIFSYYGTYVLICYNNCIRKYYLDNLMAIDIPINCPTDIVLSNDGTSAFVSTATCIYEMCLESFDMTILIGSETQLGNRCGIKEQSLCTLISCMTMSPGGKFIVFGDNTTVKYMKIKQ
jgi:WD40 repeat protein